MSHEFFSYAMDDGHGLPHDPLLSLVGPRPIGWISTLSLDGVRNLAPFSFFNLLCRFPPLMGFAPGGAKDSGGNAAATGEFVWNLVTRPLAEAMNLTSAEVAADVDEFALAGVTPLASSFVAPPRVAESPVSIECRVSQVVPLIHAGGAPSKATLIIGEACAVHIAKDMLIDGVYDTARAQPVLRAGSRGDYFEIRREGFFSLERPALRGLADQIASTMVPTAE